MSWTMPQANWCCLVFPITLASHCCCCNTAFMQKQECRFWRWRRTSIPVLVNSCAVPLSVVFFPILAIFEPMADIGIAGECREFLPAGRPCPCQYYDASTITSPGSSRPNCVCGHGRNVHRISSMTPQVRILIWDTLLGMIARIRYPNLTLTTWS